MRQSVGRSRSGRTTKVHLVTNGHGLPLAVELTDGEMSDYKGFDLVFADRIREAMGAKGGTAAIPTWRGRKNPVPVDRFAYALRNCFERAFASRTYGSAGSRTPAP